MLLSTALDAASEDRPDAAALVLRPSRAESDFYGRYRWGLNAFPTVAEASRRLRDELGAFQGTPDDWRREEMLVNVFLLACSISGSIDDHLAGPQLDFSQAAAVVPGLGRVSRAAERLVVAGRHLRAARLRRLRAWRNEWEAALDAFLRVSMVSGRLPDRVARTMSGMAELLSQRPASGLDARRIKVPAAFRTQDLTHHDLLELARRFSLAYPDNKQPLLVVGLRTAGSYFAPLVRAALGAQGYGDIDVTTLRPKRGVAPWELAPLARCAARGGMALIVDEPPDTGTTLARVVALLLAQGMCPERVVALLPIHPTRTRWREAIDVLPLADIPILTLAPEEWRKQRLLRPEAVELRLDEYFKGQGYRGAWVHQTPNAARFNRELQATSEQKFHTRSKRIYEVLLRNGDGVLERRHVLAKSVGWGWLGSHAFVAAEALQGFVPPVLGLRDGILYTQWLPQGDGAAPDREQLPKRLASYVATRATALRLAEDPGPTLDPPNQKGLELLAAGLSGAFGWKATAVLERARLQRRLSRQPSPVPTLIDGKMRAGEWILGDAALLKTDFEHHGMGKTEWNLADPAYDLADAVLQFELEPAEEELLLRQYREQSGDHGVEARLFLHKLLAGMAAMGTALQNLGDARLRHRYGEFHASYLRALEFLTAHAARACGSVCRPASPPRWGTSVVAIDVDGVLDKQLFGFPTTTAAGIAALRLFHAHGFPIALNTARPLREVQEYCRDYGLVGGSAEYGAVVWDAASLRERVLVSPESRDELRRLGAALRRVPGVFLDERRQHSLCAYAYDKGRTVPLPKGLVQGLVSELRLERLNVRQTYLDTSIVASETDKGRGLLALLDLAGVAGAEAIAIGDSEPDLAMFQVAARSFAPRHISGRGVARALGCRIMAHSYQVGLLEAARAIVHRNGGTCPACEDAPLPVGLWWELLSAADRHPLASLVRALLRPGTLRTFTR